MIEFTEIELVALCAALEVAVNDAAETAEKGIVIDAANSAFQKITEELLSLGNDRLQEILTGIDNDETHVPPRRIV